MPQPSSSLEFNSSLYYLVVFAIEIHVSSVIPCNLSFAYGIPVFAIFTKGCLREIYNSVINVPPCSVISEFFRVVVTLPDFPFFKFYEAFASFFVSFSCFGFNHSSSEKLQSLVSFAHLSGCFSFAFS